MTDAAVIVQSFLTLLENDEADAACELLAEDVVWRNTGLPTIRGRRVAGMLRDMQRRRVGFRVVMHHLAVADDGYVLTDRTDVLSYKRWESSFWVCGTFRVVDDRIALWDDHFALGNVLGASLKGLLGAVRG